MKPSNKEDESRIGRGLIGLRHGQPHICADFAKLLEAKEFNDLPVFAGAITFVAKFLSRTYNVDNALLPKVLEKVVKGLASGKMLWDQAINQLQTSCDR